MLLPASSYNESENDSIVEDGIDGQNAAEKRSEMSPTMEQYIEAIAHLLTNDKVCTVSEIAEAAQVTRPAASRAVRDLVDKQLVVHKSYGYVDLTEDGHRLADQLSTRHKILFDFLTDVMKMNVAWSDNEACRLEHQLDDALIQRLECLREFMTSNAQFGSAWYDFLSNKFTS